MQRVGIGISRRLLVIGCAALASACAKTEYVGNSGGKGFWSDNPAKVSPNDAFRKAQPHLAATWEARCEKLRNHDEYCDKFPLDHMVRRGKYYYVTRTSFPYDSHGAFTQYAVRVHVETGEVLPYE